jgi:hypothetical protein
MGRKKIHPGEQRGWGRSIPGILFSAQDGRSGEENNSLQPSAALSCSLAKVYVLTPLFGQGRFFRLVRLCGAEAEFAGFCREAKRLNLFVTVLL